MSRIDRAFAIPQCHLQFLDLALFCYPRGLSNHRQMEKLKDLWAEYAASTRKDFDWSRRLLFSFQI